jgi:hypothetical protein
VRTWERENVVVSTAERRASYVGQRLLSLLWDSGVRWHQEFRHPVVAPDGFRLKALELVRLNAAMRRSLGRLRVQASANAVALLHGELPDVPDRGLPDALARAVDLNAHHATNQRAWVTDLLPAGSLISATERVALHGTFIAAADDLPRLYDGPVPTDWEAADEWLWAMYHISASLPGPDAGQRLKNLRVSFPSQVRCLVGHGGFALVGVGPDRDAGHRYYDGADFHLATFYSDVLALVRLQNLVLEALEAEVTDIAQDVPRRVDVSRLERDLLVFRRTYWAAGFGSPKAVDHMLRAAQQDSEFQKALDHITDDLAELSRQVQGAEAESTNAILGLLAAFGLPLGAGLAIWQGLPSAGVWPLCWTLLATVLAAGGLMTAFPGLRSLLGVLRGRRDRR